MKELGEKTGVLVGLDLPLEGGGTEAGVWSPHQGNWVRGETFKAESETADLWLPKWNENQTVLAKAIHMRAEMWVSWKGGAAGSWSLGIVEQSQCEGCYSLRRDGWRECEGGDCGGKCLWRKARQPWKQGDTAESRVRGEAITIASFSTHKHWQLNNRGWPIQHLTHWTTE